MKDMNPRLGANKEVGTIFAAGIILLILNTYLLGFPDPIKPEVVTVLDEKKNLVFQTPSAVAVDEKNREIYVADQEGNVIIILSLEGREKKRFDVPLPTSIALDKKGLLYVADAKGLISIYDFKAKKLGDIKVTGLPKGAKEPTAKQIMFDDVGDIYIADIANQSVIVATPEGKFVKAFGIVGEKGKGVKFSSISGFWVSKRRVYVVDGGTSQVSVFSKTSGELLFTFGERGGSTGQLAVPVSVVADAEGRIYVLDTVRHCISIFDEEGTFLAECGGEGRSAGWFYFPKTLYLDSKGNFYVCEATLKRVQVLAIQLDKTEKKKDEGVGEKKQ